MRRSLEQRLKKITKKITNNKRPSTITDGKVKGRSIAALIAVCLSGLTLAVGINASNVQQSAIPLAESPEYFFNQAYPNYIELEPGEDLPFRLAEAVLSLKPGTIIELPAGTYYFDQEIIINTSHVTLRGQGKDQTVLNFGITPEGAEGILVLSDAFVIEDLAIEDTAGDGIRVEGSDGVIFRNLRVEWTRGPDPRNGSYGIYPVLCNNVLVENTVVMGASDSGIYVGQTNHAVIRNNYITGNVAGIEVENTKYADVYNNETIDNTSGILVFDHPGLSQMGGMSRVYNNRVYSNNLANFAPGGFLIDFVPEGAGIIVLATDDVEIFDNHIIENNTFGLFIFSHLAALNLAGGSLPDDFDPISERIHFHDNITQRRMGWRLGKGETSFLINLLFFLDGFSQPSDIIFDGYYTTTPEAAQHCIQNNERNTDPNPVSFGNIFMNEKKGLLGLLGLPGAPAEQGLKPYHDCSLPPIAPAELDFSVFNEVPEPDNDYSEEEILALCAGGDVNDVNWEAAVVDCQQLSDYRLFTNNVDPRGAANSTRGLGYDITTPLFTDYALKDRYVFVPEGERATYEEDSSFEFPVGSIIVKTFTAPMATGEDKVLETRLLILRESGWRALPYIWNDEQTEAYLALGGGLFPELEVSKPNGEAITIDYRVPNASQCTNCHGVNGEDKPIGTKARLLNKSFAYAHGDVNQLVQWRDQGLLDVSLEDLANADRLVVWDDPDDGTLEERAKAYLETNCFHCHGEGGRAYATGFLLKADQALDVRYGLCKRPIAAGTGSGNLSFDIAPGHGDESIVIYRMNSNEPAVRMPELGRSVIHEEGVDLVRAWIDSLPEGCD